MADGRRRIGSRLALVVAVGLAAWSSTWMVGRDEQGVVTRFGRVVRVAGSGIHFTLPWPLEWMELVQPGGSSFDYVSRVSGPGSCEETNHGSSTTASHSAISRPR